MRSISPVAKELRWIPSTRAVRADRVRCVLLHEQRFLLAQHNSRRRENVGKWGLPGGRLRKSEPPKACLRRELMEELELRVPYLIDLGDWRHRGEIHRVFGCEIEHPVETFDADEIRAIRWFTDTEVAELAATNRLQRGFELAAITAFQLCQYDGRP